MEEKKSSILGSAWELIKFGIIAALIVVPIRMLVAQPFIVSGSSMLPTFENGDYLIVDEISYKFNEPQRGDIIIFRFPAFPTKFLIKRVIGLPNEKIEIRNNIIKIYNNDLPEGKVLKEDYLKRTPKMKDLTVVLGKDEYFVLGDNREKSSDSRIWGGVDKRLIIGRALIRLWPPTKLKVF
jgi:signal peptidase I